MYHGSKVKEKIKKKMKARQILLPTSVRMEMVRTFKITRSTLDRALKYTGNSARDNMLRAAAFKRGGVIYLGLPAPTGYIPDVATSFENGYMRQKFGERLEVILHLETNKAILKIDGQEAAKFEGLTVGAWGNMLYSLQQIYNRISDPHPAYSSKAKPIESEIRTTDKLHQNL